MQDWSLAHLEKHLTSKTVSKGGICMTGWFYDNFVFCVSGFLFFLISLAMADNAFSAEIRNTVSKFNNSTTTSLICYTATFIMSFACLFFLNSPLRLIIYIIVQLLNFIIFYASVVYGASYKTCSMICLFDNKVLLFVLAFLKTI